MPSCVPVRQEVPSSSARDSPHPPPPPRAALPHSKPAAVAQPDAKSGASGYTADTPAITFLSMLHVQPAFACKLKRLARKRARVEFVASTWEVDMQAQV